MKVEETLKERGERYGSFDGYAVQLEALKNAVDLEASCLNCVHKAGMEMILTKIARIMNGDPDYVDNWHDIAGYATLVERDIEKNF